MKTIKELEAEIGKAKDIIMKSFAYEEIRILKDVLGLIDELIEFKLGCNIDAEELKARING